MIIFLESLWPILSIGIAVEAVLAIALLVTRRGMLLWWMLGAAGFVLAGLLIEWLVVTDREAIDAADLWINDTFVFIDSDPTGTVDEDFDLDDVPDEDFDVFTEEGVPEATVTLGDPATSPAAAGPASSVVAETSANSAATTAPFRSTCRPAKRPSTTPEITPPTWA